MLPRASCAANCRYPKACCGVSCGAGPQGIKIRKQHPVGRYVIDFYCAQAKTGFEVDGIAHDMGDRPERDERRTTWLGEQGIRLVRIPAKDVLADPPGVAAAIVALCLDRTK